MHGAKLGMVALCTLVGSSAADVIVEGGAGWADVDTVWGGKVRNMTHTNGDWEMALGQTPGGFATHAHTTWAASGAANSFALSYSNLTGDVSLEWNGNLLTWNDPDPAKSVAIQLLARGKSGGDAAFTVGDLGFNGDAIDLGAFGGFASAGTTVGHGSASYLLLGGDEFETLDAWTLTGTLTAEWSGATPSRDLSRIEFIGSNERLTIPAPAGVAVIAATALAVSPRRRR